MFDMFDMFDYRRVAQGGSKSNKLALEEPHQLAVEKVGQIQPATAWNGKRSLVVSQFQRFPTHKKLCVKVGSAQPSINDDELSSSDAFNLQIKIAILWGFPLHHFQTKTRPHTRQERIYNWSVGNWIPSRAN